MSDEFPYIFDSPIVAHSVGRYDYSVVFLPAEMNEEMPFEQYPRLRIRAEIGEVAIAAALQPVRGRWYLLLSKKLMKKGGWELGDWVSVRFRIDDQDAVDVPEILQQALEEDGQAIATWNNLTAGKKRGLAYRVASAKTKPTQERRVAEVVKMLVLGEF